jgi:hypothetical protein
MSTLSDRRRDRRNRAAFNRAKTKAGEDGMVCGYTDPEGNPRYFVTPRGTPDEEVRERAFQAIHGRPMNRAEQLLDAAQSGDLIRAYEQAMTHYLDRTPVADV